MLKRVNIHLEEMQLTELDKIAVETGKVLMAPHHITDPSRADLIRFAISRTYGLSFKTVHYSKDALWEAIRKVRNNLPT